MKKHLPSLLLCAVLALVCTSCSSGTTTQNSSTPSSAVSAESTASETSGTASQTVSDNTSTSQTESTVSAAESGTLIDESDPLKSQKEIIFQTLKALVNDPSANIRNYPSRLPTYTSELSKALQEQGVQFTFISFTADKSDPLNLSLYRAYGTFGDGTKWGFVFSDFLPAETN